MAINFPASPNLNETFVSGGVTYTWDGTVWVASGSAAFVQKSGDTMTGDLTVPSLNSGPLAGMRNQLINPDFRIWQRGTPPMAASSVYTADRWYTNANVATVERKLYNNPPGTGGGFDMRAQSAANMQVRQGIELPKGATTTASPFDVGTQWTISLWSTRVPSVQFDFANGVNGGNTVSVYAMTQMNSTSETSGVYTKYSATFTINVSPDINNNECLSMRLQHTAGAVGESWIIAGVQLEPGPVATPFEVRPIQTELALCQRYYQVLDRIDMFMASETSASNSRSNNWTFATAMRAAPTVDFTRSGGTSLVVFSTSTSSARFSGATGGTTGTLTALDVTADAEL